ncbi:hypothetical protein MOTT12_05090 [Mycobacterium intracellulare subsp. yongonense]|nr:hypothetical protein MOTT12_05090 [Mycobacterium intracellulare subsp. yongonense]ETZ28212.1 hypothetical protein L843_5514 [Mycobacterium intracellulare MIN_061107_1834]
MAVEISSIDFFQLDGLYAMSSHRLADPDDSAPESNRMPIDLDR